MSDQVKKTGKLGQALSKAGDYIKTKAPVLWENHSRVAASIEEQLVKLDVAVQKPKMRLLRQSLLLNLLAAFFIIFSKGVNVLDLFILIFPQILLFPSFVRALGGGSAVAIGDAAVKEREKSDNLPPPSEA